MFVAGLLVAGLVALLIFGMSRGRAVVPEACECKVNQYDCTDFKSIDDAQICFDRCYESVGDVHLLDRDGDKEVCEVEPEGAGLQPLEFVQDGG